MINILKVLKKKIIEFLESGALFSFLYDNPYKNVGGFKETLYSIIVHYQAFYLLREGYAIRTFIELFSHAHYENFLLVMLCKYDLGLIQFGLLKVFSCGLLLWSCVEFTFGFIDVITALTPHITDFIYGLYSAPSLPDAHTLENLGMLIEPTSIPVDMPTSDPSVQQEADKLEAIKAAELAKAKDRLINRGHVYACAAFILYVGMQVAKSGGC